jgi:hypothetical protein
MLSAASPWHEAQDLPAEPSTLFHRLRRLPRPDHRRVGERIHRDRSRVSLVTEQPAGQHFIKRMALGCLCPVTIGVPSMVSFSSTGSATSELALAKVTAAKAAAGYCQLSFHNVSSSRDFAREPGKLRPPALPVVPLFT